MPDERRAIDEQREVVTVMFDHGSKDHLGPITCGPSERTRCGRPLYPYGYPTPGQRFDPSQSYTCKTCAGAADA